MFQCYICEKEINKTNKYKEHIILNAIGGKLCNSNLICKCCSKSFDSIDTALAKQLNTITCLLNVKRDRSNKKIPPIQGISQDSGETIYLEAGGKPVLHPKPPEKKGEGYQLQARNPKDLEKQLEGLARNNTGINVEKLMKEITEKIKNGEIPTQHDLNSSIDLRIEIDGEEFWRAICKMAVNFYIHKGGKRQYIVNLIPYIKEGKKTRECSKWYYLEKDILPDFIEEGKVVHSISLKGDSKKKILYSFVQIYSAFQFIVLINDNYEGKDINEYYFFDVIERKQFEPNVNLQINLNEINDHLKLKSPPSNIISEMEKLVKFIEEKPIRESFDEKNRKTIEGIHSKYSEGEIIKEEDFRELFNQLAFNIVEFLMKINDLSRKKFMQK